MSVYVEKNHQNNFSQCLPHNEINYSLASIGNPVNKVFKIISLWIDRASQRKKLAKLDSRMLDDIGLTDADVQSELAKPFWK